MHYECLIDSRVRPPLCLSVCLSVFLLFGPATLSRVVARIVIYPLSPLVAIKCVAQEISSKYAVSGELLRGWIKQRTNQDTA